MPGLIPIRSVVNRLEHNKFTARLTPYSETFNGYQWMSLKSRCREMDRGGEAWREVEREAETDTLGLR